MAGEGIITPRYLISLIENWPQDESGVPVTDTGWFNSSIYVQILAARAALVDHLYKKDPATISRYMQYTIGCIQLEEEAVENCPCTPPSGCTWFAADIPTPIGGLTAVTGIGGNLKELIHYTFRPWETIKYNVSAIISGERERAFYTEKNNRIFLISKGHEEVVSTAATWYDPVEAQRWPNCQKVDPCKNFLDYDLYIPPEYAQAVVAAALDVITGMRKTAKFDNRNDALPK